MFWAKLKAAGVQTYKSGYTYDDRDDLKDEVLAGGNRALL